MNIQKHFLAFSIILAVLYSSNLYSQEDKGTTKHKKPFSERIFVGGALGFSIGNQTSLIDVSPIFGYEVTDDFIAGLGFTYKYYKYKDYYWNLNNKESTDFISNIYGMSIWSRYYLTKLEMPIIENIFLHAEIEPLTFINKYSMSLNGEYIDPWGNKYVKRDDRINVTGIFFGGGLRQMLGGRSYLYLEVVWDFNESLYSPYSNPRIRIGVAASF